MSVDLNGYTGGSRPPKKSQEAAYLTPQEIAEALGKAHCVGREWVCLCPCHDDHEPSLWITEGENGKSLVICRAGCLQDKVIAELRRRGLWPSASSERLEPQHEVAHYSYHDAAGVLRYQVVRSGPKKKFKQRRPNGSPDSYIWNMDGVEPLPYRLPDLLSQPDVVVYIAEGEKDVDNLYNQLGLVATCNHGGAGKWRPEISQWLAGRHVVILPDNDEPGRNHAQDIAQKISGIAASVKIVELPGLPPKGDVSDWIAAGGTRELLEKLVNSSSDNSLHSKKNFRNNSWIYKLKVNKNGNPKATLANSIIALTESPEWRDILWYDEFRMRVVIRGATPWMDSESEEDWQDHFDVATAIWLQQYEIDVTPTTVAQIVDLIARRNTFHPVRDYLNRVSWDGINRLDSWLIDYLGVEPDIPDQNGTKEENDSALKRFEDQSKYIVAVGKRWMISAVARIFIPGCKADCALILEGEQGRKKSTAIKILSEPWFADELNEFGSKESAILIAGVWIVELAELSALHRSDIERAKSYMSRTTDHYRPVWGRRWIDQPRQCVFAGTTNSSEYMSDSTGGRRWWPVICGEINIEALELDRDQLWAEAVIAFRNGERWHIEGDELNAIAAIEQAARAKTDVWDDHIRDFLKDQVLRDNFQGKQPFVTRSEVLRDLGVPDRDQTQTHANRVADCLIRFGWERFRIGSGAMRGAWAYRPKAPKTGNKNG